MTARSIADILRPAIDSALALSYTQHCLDDLCTPAGRKRLIMWHWQIGILSPAEATMLITANMLEAA